MTMDPDPTTIPEPAAIPDAAPADDAAPSDGAEPTVRPEDASLLDLIDRLAALLDRTELAELEVQVGATGLVLRKPSALAPVAAVGVPSAAGGGGEAGGAAAAAAADAGPLARPAIMAPLTGIWYGAPAPGSAPYVSLAGRWRLGR